eukprot:6399570-Alexandrium_andersonii.AAC.1
MLAPPNESTRMPNAYGFRASTYRQTVGMANTLLYDYQTFLQTARFECTDTEPCANSTAQTQH